jgi:hypothetical protein
MHLPFTVKGYGNRHPDRPGNHPCSSPYMRVGTPEPQGGITRRPELGELVTEEWSPRAIYKMCKSAPCSISIKRLKANLDSTFLEMKTPSSPYQFVNARINFRDQIGRGEKVRVRFVYEAKPLPFVLHRGAT